MPAMTLLQYIEKHHLKYPPLAKRCGLAVSTVWRVANGLRQPSLKTAVKIHKGCRGEVSLESMMAVKVRKRRRKAKR